jgi:quinol monooxygenase YgiN
MSNTVSWLLSVNVKDGQLETFRSLMYDMVASTNDEPGSLIYEWAISEDEATIDIYERYTDSAAALAHLGTFGSDFGERFFGAVDPISFHVYDNPDAATSEGLAGAGAEFFAPFGGHAR